MKVVSLGKLREKVKSLMFDVDNILEEISEDDIIITNISAPEKKPRKPRKEKKVVKEEVMKYPEENFNPSPKPKRGRHKKFYQDEPVQSEGDPSLK